jgi:hypothetical protein
MRVKFIKDFIVEGRTVINKDTVQHVPKALADKVVHEYRVATLVHESPGDTMSDIDQLQKEHRDGCKYEYKSQTY